MSRRWPAWSRLAICGLLVAAPGCATARVHSVFKERQRSIHVVAALPPDVTVYRLTFKGDHELLHEHVPPMTATVIREIETSFRQKGYTVPHLDPADPQLTQDPQLRSAIFNAQQVFAKRLEEIHRHWRFATFDHTIGPEVNQFADLARSDALVFSRCEGVKKSGGEIARDVAKTTLIAAATLGGLLVIYPTAATIVQIGVVDGDTGELLWYHSNLNTDQARFDPTNTKKLAKVVRGLLKPFPRASTATAGVPRSAPAPGTRPVLRPPQPKTSAR